MLLVFLIVSAAASQCPYCTWSGCDAADPIPVCCECYNIAGLVPVVIRDPQTNNVLAGGIGVCQLCPDHCDKCYYALLTPDWTAPKAVLNCTQCQQGYVNNPTNGKCDPCHTSCDGQCKYKVQYPTNGPGAPYMYMQCQTCNKGKTQDPVTSGCQACPAHCTRCACGPSYLYCPYLTCTDCSPGYALTPKANGQGYECV